MEFKMTVNMDNAAFERDGELARIVREVAARLTRGEESGIALDMYGNNVCTFEITD